MTVVVRMDDEHRTALLRASVALNSEAILLRRYNLHSVELQNAIDNIGELLDRYNDQTRQHVDPWSRKVTT